MQNIEITQGIYWVGVNDQQTELFEGLWPIKNEGISYNSYLITDEHHALIDLCKGLQGNELVSNIQKLIDLNQLEYVVINHMEPDHSGALELLLKAAPQLTLLCSERAVAMLKSFFGISDHIRVVQDGEKITLGKHTLQFFYTPNVHWPETIMTYEAEEQVLFSCDGFGGYGKLENGLFDDDCGKLEFYEKEALRYFSNIVASFSKPTLAAIEKLSGLPIQMVAPSHGLVWRKNPSRIISLYQQWAQYAREPGQPGITLIHGSMYGNTDIMLGAIEDGLREVQIPFQSHDVTHTAFSYILPSLWTMQGVAIGAPTYEGRLFPSMLQVLDFALAKHIPPRKAIYFGSYGWGGGALRQIQERMNALNWELVNTLEFAGRPTTQDLKRGREIAKELGQLLETK